MEACMANTTVKICVISGACTAGDLTNAGKSCWRAARWICSFREQTTHEPAPAARSSAWVHAKRSRSDRACM